MLINDKYTFDSARTKDSNGYMHVAVSNLTKEQVVPYMGDSIPGYKELGLEPDKVYQIYRPADEIEKAVETFNGLPLMLDHWDMDAENIPKDKVVGCLVYIDTGDVTDEDLRLPLGNDSDTFKLDSIKGLKIIEPFYIAPGRYSCFNPIDKDYFVPQTWLINGREVHASRFLYFAEDKPPTVLLPSYNFFGVPLAQTVIDSVIGFEESSKSAARMLSKYACTVFKTDMNEVLSGGTGSEIQKRIAYFAKYRDNDGVMTIDKEAEDIMLANHSLGGVTDIVRQQMEIVAAMFGEPAVKLWGISPNGFNATGESDMRSHYDHINAVQERIIRDPLTYLIELLQLNKFGQVDDSLTFEFVPLSDEDEKLQAEVQKIKVDSMSQLFDRGIISGEEARHVLATDPESGFDDIDEDSVPEPPDLALPVDLPGGEMP